MDENKEIQGCAGSCGTCGGCGSSSEDEKMSPIITLTDDDGNDVRFEILDVVIMPDEKEYLVVSEVKDENVEGDVEVVILEIKDVDGEEVYDTVVDEKIAETVFEEFVSQQEGEDEE